MSRWQPISARIAPRPFTRSLRRRNDAGSATSANVTATHSSDRDLTARASTARRTRRSVESVLRLAGCSTTLTWPAQSRLRPGHKDPCSITKIAAVSFRKQKGGSTWSINHRSGRSRDYSKGHAETCFEELRGQSGRCLCQTEADEPNGNSAARALNHASLREVGRGQGARDGRAPLLQRLSHLALLLQSVGSLDSRERLGNRYDHLTHTEWRLGVGAPRAGR
jgi:hypothetical protein